MKIRLTVIFICLAIFPSLAQYDSKGELISRFRPGIMWFYTGLKPAQEDKIRRYDRLIFDITYNDWIGDEELFKNHWASIGFNTNLMFDIPLSKGNKVSFGIGIQHQLTRIRHDREWIYQFETNQTNLVTNDSIFPFDKGIYGANTFALPIELRFRNEGWKHFKLHLGGKIGYQINAFNKTVDNSADVKTVNKVINFPDQNSLIYAAHVRLGLRNYALFGSYQFNKMFSNKNSSQLNVIQLGLSVSLF